MKPNTVEKQISSNFAEIRNIILNCPTGDNRMRIKAKQHWNSLVKPIGSLGYLETAIEHLAMWQHSGPHILRPRIVVFAGNHGISKKGVSAYPASVTESMIRVIQARKSAITAIAELASCDLRLYDLQLDKPVNDCSEMQAMTEAEASNAICYGMTSVEEGVDILACGEIGIGNTTSASALSALHNLDTPVERWVGKGTGIGKEQLEHKISIVKKIVDLHKGKTGLEAIAAVGGREMAAIAGAIIAARIAKCVVILDGFTVTSVALALQKENYKITQHCLAGHLSSESGHRHLLKKLKLKPLLQLRLRLGEGTGATLAISLLRSALGCYNKMGLIQEVL